MRTVSAKKNLGQHFLKEIEKAGEITQMFSFPGNVKQILEIGPGMGILTGILFENTELSVKCVDIDTESIQYLHDKYPESIESIVEGDFLRMNLSDFFKGEFNIIGNFPYNISSQILFKILEYRKDIPEVVGMFQKEVAQRIAGTPGGREYGILSVFMQAWYNVEMRMTLNEDDFNPPPKVKSAVLHFIRKENFVLGCDEKLFRVVVKTAFNQRRKTLRNALASLWPREISDQLIYADLRAEALGWNQFVELTNVIASKEK